VPKSSEEVHPFSESKVTRVYDVLESMFNMFVQTSFMGTEERKDVASDWFTNSTEMLGNALGCEICLGGMKGV